MSSELVCPECKTVLKEKGDEMKSATDEYKILPSDGVNDIKCLTCGHVDSAIEFYLE